MGQAKRTEKREQRTPNFAPINPSELTQKAAGKKKENKKFFATLAKQNKGQLDNAFHNAHEEVFAETDCLECANCCKTTSPIMMDKDIERISKYKRMRPGDFIEKHLLMDNEGHYIFTHAPCPMLEDDNACSIYEIRPRACREYPHTDRRNMKGILQLTLKNIEICPAVYEMVERIKEKR